MSIEIVTTLGSILESSTELNSNSTQRANKTITTSWSGGTVQVQVQVWVPAYHLAITQKRRSRIESKAMTANIFSQALGARFWYTALTGQTGKHKHRAVLNLWQLLLVATCGNGILLDFARTCHRPKQSSLLCSLGSLFWSVIGLWVKIRYQNKSSCSKSNLVPCSRSKSTTCPRNGRLYKFKMKSTTTSNSDACLKLSNDLLHGLQSITTKVCSQNGCIWKVMS